MTDPIEQVQPADVPRSDVPSAGTDAEVDVASAMAVYSADGQVDDASGGDAAAELLRSGRTENRTGGIGEPDGPA